MPIPTRNPAPPTFMQKFRALTESLLMEVAQNAILREYSGIGNT